ncbi:hypothetical protein GP486_005216 [Trichoglossum hirsutum]|uniref:CCD97-like C-terminal domain-containing protein n=1 Tax=Trichoglossum hirsutum TaxID=265104 RepID=A0A9P8L9P2_9PEZI|nr:hypothetical protein GP486_005216 [Trichoglossum hirsutum]
MPHFPRDIYPLDSGASKECIEDRQFLSTVNAGDDRAARIRVKNRRKMYLDKHPEYFSSSLELADPLLYDRCIRRFQSAAEREAEGRQKGYSGVLEADLMRSEAKLAALANPSSAAITYSRGPNGEIYPEDPEDVPQNKAEGIQRWQREMTQRFLRGEDDDFDYKNVDENDEWDDKVQEEREEQERWFAEEEPSWILGENEGSGNEKMTVKGETGVQDF